MRKTQVWGNFVISTCLPPESLGQALDFCSAVLCLAKQDAADTTCFFSLVSLNNDFIAARMRVLVEKRVACQLTHDICAGACRVASPFPGKCSAWGCAGSRSLELWTPLQRFNKNVSQASLGVVSMTRYRQGTEEHTSLVIHCWVHTAFEQHTTKSQGQLGAGRFGRCEVLEPHWLLRLLLAGVWGCSWAALACASGCSFRL